MLKRWFSIAVLCLFTLPTALYAPNLDEFDIEDEGLCPATVAAAGRFGPLLHAMSQGPSGTFVVDELWSSDQFQRFLQRHDKVGVDVSDEPGLLAVYLDAAFTPYESAAKLPVAQGKAIIAAMAAHGVTAGSSETGQELLARVSRDNRKRLLAGREYENGKIAAMREAETLLAGLSFQFTHNAPRTVKRPEVPLVSSRRLQTMGFTGGLNTAEYNQWLKSDDSVFFYAHPALLIGDRRTVAATPRNMGAQYGEHQAELVTGYGDAVGWISYYNMDVDDLLAFGKSQCPDEFKEAVRLLHVKFNFDGDRRRPFDDLLERRGFQQDQAWRLVSQVRGLAAVLEKIRNKLHRLDFTVPDFREILRQTMLHELNAARISSASKLRDAIGKLRVGDPRELRTVLQTYGFGPLAIPDDFELKIPVAVPQIQLMEPPADLLAN